MLITLDGVRCQEMFQGLDHSTWQAQNEGKASEETEDGEAVSSRFVRAETIFPAAQRAGRKVAVITAKEKLRDIFASGLIAAGRDVVLGRTLEHHDLAKLHGGLRSHGGRYEEMVPFVFSHPVNSTFARRAAGDPRNFHIFDFTLNGTRC